MFKKMIDILYSSLMWNVLRLRLRINKNKVIIVLVNENPKLDYYAMVHLNDFVRRKCGDGAIILLNDKKTYKMVRTVNPIVNLRIYHYPKNRIKKLYSYYSYYKFSERIVFTYTDHPKDNQLGKVLRETQVNEEDAVCLGLYHLRKVPTAIERQNHV